MPVMTLPSWLTGSALRERLGSLKQLLRHPSQLSHLAAVRRDARQFEAQCARWQAAGDVSAPAAGAKTALFVSLTDWVVKAKTECALALALKARGWRPVILTYRWCRTAQRYYRACGLRDFVFLDDIATEPIPASTLQDAAAWLAGCRTIQAIKDWRVRDVHIGRQMLASITRSNHRNVDLNDPAHRQLLLRAVPEALQSVRTAERLLEETRPELAIFLDKDYLGIGAIYDTAINRGLNVIQWCGSQRDDGYTLKRYTPQTRHTHPQSIGPTTWSWVRELPWTGAEEAALRQEFTGRYEAGQWTSYYNRPYGRLRAKEELATSLGLDPSKPTAVVFSHILWDSTFFWGDDLFDDYAEWLVETAKAACANPRLNWIIKLHPANAWKLQREGIKGELYDHIVLRQAIGELPPHVRVLDPEADVNTFSLFSLTDYCLTVRGTIGIEMACFGIPVLTAGTGRYSGLSFTIDSVSRKEYLAKLSMLETQPKPTAEQTALAKRYAHALFVLRPWYVRSLRSTYLPTRQLGHPLDHNLELEATSLRGLAEAPDLRAFAEWAASREADFVSRPQPHHPGAERTKPMVTA